jgi:SAM-dependent methyltransferase
MPDLSIAFPPSLQQELLRVIDVEGKIPAALEALGPVVDRDVVVLDCGAGHFCGRLEAMGARVAAFEFPLSEQAAADLTGWVGRADAVVIPWSEQAAPGSRFLAEAGTLLRPGGRLLVIHDYGRDDIWGMMPELRPRLVDWSHRKGPFLRDGFRIRVIHCWWTFESMEEARELLETAWGKAGLDLADKMAKPRLEYSVAVFHRSAAAAGAIGDEGLEASAGSGLVPS